MSHNTIEEINHVIGYCALCHDAIYADDSGYILTGAINQEKLTYTCPYCQREHRTNEGSTEALQNGTVIFQCEYCGRESISPVTLEGSDLDQALTLQESVNNA